MKEIGLVFTGESVRAYLAGRKTQTRRLVVPPKRKGADTDKLMVYYMDRAWVAYSSPGHPYLWVPNRHPDDPDVADPANYYGAYPVYPRVEVGDQIWWKETFGVRTYGMNGKINPPLIEYAADEDLSLSINKGCWKSPRFMPKRFARLWLPVTEVRVQRLQDITEEDAIAEGINVLGSPVIAFAALWDDLNGKRAPWESNPWVCAITFPQYLEPI